MVHKLAHTELINSQDSSGKPQQKSEFPWKKNREMLRSCSDFFAWQTTLFQPQ